MFAKSLGDVIMFRLCGSGVFSKEMIFNWDLKEKQLFASWRVGDVIAMPWAEGERVLRPHRGQGRPASSEEKEVSVAEASGGDRETEADSYLSLQEMWTGTLYMFSPMQGVKLVRFPQRPGAFSSPSPSLPSLYSLWISTLSGSISGL